VSGDCLEPEKAVVSGSQNGNDKSGSEKQIKEKERK